MNDRDTCKKKHQQHNLKLSGKTNPPPKKNKNKNIMLDSPIPSFLLPNVSTGIFEHLFPKPIKERDIP